tara:strand:- start:1957 stop:2448 length:492 start_codon:yes stop_codon:yes gene_type:complete
MWEFLSENFSDSGTNYRGTTKSYKNTTKICGILAAILCFKILRDKYEKVKEQGDDWTSMFGDTSLDSIIKSSVFGFSFIISLTMLSEHVIHITDEIKHSIESGTSITNIPIPSQVMPIFISLLVAEAAELVAEPYFENVEGKFELGHFTGIWLGTMVSQYLSA